MTRSKLKQLSDADLLVLVDLFDVDGVDSEDFDRNEVEDLVFLACEEQRNEREGTNTFPISYHEQRFESLDELFGSEPVPNEWGYEFPEHYNVTRIELMLRDPSWAYTYWDISVADKTRVLKEENFSTLLLRLEELHPTRSPSELHIMDVPITLSDSSWYVNLKNRDTSYRIHLMAQRGNTEEILASSQKIWVPHGGLSEKLEVMDSFETDALIFLSGIDLLNTRGVDVDIPQRILTYRDRRED